MKLKAQQVMNATVALATIINEGRAMPQKGKYRVARLHAKLFTEWQHLDARRKAILEAHQVALPVDAEAPGEPEYAIPADKQAEADAEWADVLADEIEVDVEPIPLAYLDMGESVDGSISAGELQTLGDLVRE